MVVMMTTTDGGDYDDNDTGCHAVVKLCEIAQTINISSVGCERGLPDVL